MIVLIMTPFVGSTNVNFMRAFDFHLPFNANIDAQKIFLLRMPRILMAALAGASLALSGLVFQALLRNPLADPFTLGVSSGAAFGAVVVIKSGLQVTLWGFSTVTIAAFCGALLSIGLVFLFARLLSGRFSMMILILSGISISFFFSALILFIHYLADFTETYHMIRWLMGGVDVVNYDVILRLLPFCLFGFLILFAFGRHLNVISSGEEFAIARGIDVPKIQKIAFITTSLLTGVVVSICGPIGFIGLIVPHILRLLVGADHRLLIPTAIFFGASFLILCDTLARTIIAPAEIPVGVLTALVGGPFFIWLLQRKRHSF